MSVPQAPTNVVVVTGDGSATVSWNPPASDGGSPIIRYIVELNNEDFRLIRRQVSPSDNISTGPTPLFSTTCIGLNTETLFTITIEAQNGYGYSIPITTRSFLPILGPDAPTNVNILIEGSEIYVYWDAPETNSDGVPTTGFTIIPSVGTPLTIDFDTFAILTDLPTGVPITITVVAINGGGSSPSEPVGPFTFEGPATVPGVPTGVSAVAGNGSATVFWTAPADGGSPITGYTVTPSVGSPVTVGNVLTANITGLTNGTPVSFTVTARNSVGDSYPSPYPSNTVTPVGPPSPPRGLTVTAVGNGSVSLSWFSPLQLNGAWLTGYTITPSVGSPVTIGTIKDYTVTGLTNGTPLTFTVSAINTVGTSLPTEPTASVTPATVPDSPNTPSATAGNASAVVSWSAPSNGGSAITNYIITPSTGSPVTVGNILTTTITGLTNGTPVSFTVTARNSVGDSYPSPYPSNTVTPFTTPGTPTGVSAVAGNGSATVSWTAPSDGGSPITGYIATSSTGLTVTVGNVLSAVFTGLVNGTPLTFTVKAVNSAGNSSLSTPSSAVTPATVPNAPTSVSATAGNASAVVSWSAPSVNGGSAITNYIITPSSGSPVTVGNVLTATITGLTNGSPVTFTVAARNSKGDSLSSVSSSVTPDVLPNAPTGVSATRGNASAVVSWSAPPSNGSSAITGYIVTPSVGVAVTVGNVLTTTITGLTNGTPVTFTVKAINALGNSSSSSASSAITPATNPGAPTAVTAAAGNASASVSWSAPSNGGSDITGYIITPSTGSPVTVGNVLTTNILGLTNGTSITFTVVAVNSVGNSASSSPSLAVIPNIVPGAPTGVSATAGNASAVVTWSVGVNNGTPITNYIVTPSIGAPITVGNVLTATVSGLQNGTALTFTVTAVNSSGNSSPSAASSSVTPATNPGAPTAVTATPGNASAVVSWSAPSDGGSAITGYIVTPSTGSPVTVGNVLTTTIVGLGNGTSVTFTVVARNSRGDSSSSSPSAAVTPATVPNAPTGVSATRGNTSAVVSWSAPFNGGSSITNYIVTPSVGVAVTVGNVLTTTMTGLTNGTPLTFTVTAVNSLGNSSSSSASSSVTPATNPGAPTAVTAIPGNASASVSWSAPSSTGGSAITGYIVTPSTGSPVTVGNVLTTNVTGLTNGNSVSFTVVAVNSVGNSTSSSPSLTVVPNIVPGAPTGVSATAGNASAVVTWSAGQNNGTPVTNYIVTPSVGAPITVGNVLTTTLTGLQNGTALTFTVMAVNSSGNSSPSAASSPVTPATNPGAPTAVTATAGNASASVSWSAPSSNGGAAITNYIITPSTGSPVTVGNVLTATITGLTNGSPVTFTVVARNSKGDSLSSVSSSITPDVLPNAPTGVSATRGNASAVVSWSAPPSNGGTAITGYIVTPSAGAAITVGNVLSATLTGLTNGTPVTFTVTAVNSLGNSSSSSASSAITPATLPGTPTAVSATPGNASASVSWSAPSDGGSAITGYIVTSSLGVVLNVGNVLTTNVTGLTNGTSITFTVIAVNSVGNSTSSSPSLAVIPNIVPGAPTGVSATAGNASAVVSWSAGQNNGTPVTNYIVTPSVGTAIMVGNVLTATLTGLENGTALTFTVMAANSAGNSPQSAASSSVTPATNPGTPTAVSAIRGNASAVVSWSAPSNGGSAITNYTITPSSGAPVTVGNVLTATIVGLENGAPVTFTVVARNSVGESSASSPSAAVTPATLPNAPIDVSATPGNASAVVEWSAPSNGGSAITGYIVTPSSGSPVTVGNVLSATITGLTNGTPVTFTVVARNSVGDSSSSSSPPVTPANVPNAPTDVSAVSGSGSVVVTWSAPASDGGSEVTGYIVTPSVGSAITVGDVLTANVSGLTDGIAITFTVTAMNNVGNSPASAPSSSVTPLSVPDSPTNVSAVAGVNSATVSWVAPLSNGGSEITGYTITPSTGDVVTVGNVLTTTLTGLATNPVTFTVVAINSAGTSLPSLASNTIIPTPPIAGPPTSVLGLTGLAGVASATISWTPPVSNGGAVITGYKVVCVPDNKKPNLAGPNDRSLLVTNLKNTVPASFRVVALNAAGQSDSVALTAYTLPSVPKVTVVRGASGVINLTWTAKPSNVASPITGYIVSVVSPLPAPVAMLIPTPTVTLTGGACSVSGLADGTSYVFSVKSVSNIGQSLGGLSKPLIAARTPDVPAGFAGVRAVKSVSLSWMAPANSGGLPITGYTISYTIAGAMKLVNVKLVTSAIIKGLVDGTAYTFRIKATTLAGQSAESEPVTVTPGTAL